MYDLALKSCKRIIYTFRITVTWSNNMKHAFKRKTSKSALVILALKFRNGFWGMQDSLTILVIIC